MNTVVHATLALRRAARSYAGFAVACAIAALTLAGVFVGQPPRFDWPHFAVGATWLGLFAIKAVARWRDHTATARAQFRSDLEMALLLLVGVHAVVQAGGGLTGSLYPLIYILVAFVASFAVRAVGALFVLAALALESGLYFVTEHQSDARPFALHAVFIVFFGILNLLFTRVEIARVRQHSRRELDQEKERAREDVRLFRLVAAPTDGRGWDQERLFRSSIEEVHQALYHSLDLVKRALDLHTCVLLMLNDAGTEMRIAELVTDSDDIADGPFPAGEGVVGAIANRGTLMNLDPVRPGYRGLCYYRGNAKIRSFLGVPVFEDGHVRGALCADRLDGRPFTPRDEDVLQGAVRHILRAIENERVFAQLERSKHDQSILYRASQALGTATTEEMVIDAALDAAHEIAQYDFAAVTLYDPKSRRHTVKRAVGEGAEPFLGLRFSDNTSLAAMVVKNRHYLPYRAEFDPKQQVAYTKRHNLSQMQSLLILPLNVGDHAIGTLGVGAIRREAFGKSLRATMQVLSNQVAVSLANAASVKRLEELATTDGLTGCLNKRAFLEELERKMRSAARFQRRLSLVVTDIDHFKSVNDTYGHATGDVVIRSLGEILRRVKRETDIVARFGGEEFCVLCEETGAEGATLLAERVREELANTFFQTDLGKLKVTCSLGVATFPKDAKSGQGLFETADRALYVAKRSGRNRVCTAGHAA